MWDQIKEIVLRDGWMKLAGDALGAVCVALAVAVVVMLLPLVSPCVQ